MTDDWIDDVLREWARDYRGGYPNLETVCILGILDKVRGRTPDPSQLSEKVEAYLCELNKSAPLMVKVICSEYLTTGMNKGDKAKMLKMRKADYLSRLKNAKEWMTYRFKQDG
jgi:hypothetical protein